MFENIFNRKQPVDPTEVAEAVDVPISEMPTTDEEGVVTDNGDDGEEKLPEAA